jgi:hypothetical protein
VEHRSSPGRQQGIAGRVAFFRVSSDIASCAVLRSSDLPPSRQRRSLPGSLSACSDFDANRQFLLDYVERVIFDHYKVTLVGSVPLQTVLESSELPFRIEGQINIAAMRSKSGGLRRKPCCGSIAQLSDAQVKNQTISRHTAVEIEYW